MTAASRDRSPVEAYLDNAKTALAGGDAVSAGVFLGAALVEDPAQSEALFLLDAVLGRLSDPLAICAPFEGPLPPLGDALVRVQALARAARTAEALALLVEVGASAPERPYLAWTAPLVASALPLAESELTLVLAGWEDAFPGLVAWGEAAVALGHADPLLERAEEIGSPPLRVLAASLLRKRGDHDRALSLAEQAHAEAPGFGTLVSLALVHQAVGAVDLAIACYESALTVRPDELRTRTSLADLLGDGGFWSGARAQCEAILATEPGHPWAAPSLLFARLELGEESARRELEAYAASHPANPRARELVVRATPYLGWLPQPTAPLLRAGARLARAWSQTPPAEGTPVSVVLDSVPSPSAVLAFYMLLVRHRIATAPRISVKSPPQSPWAPSPAPRVQLWRGTPLAPVAALPEAPDEIDEAVAALAEQRFDLSTWAALADFLVSRSPSLGLVHALAVMVRPPPVPAEMPPWAWLQRVQIAGALLAARLPGGKEALLDVLWGPEDGTVEAAALALAELAAREPDVEAEIAHAIHRRLDATASDADLRFPLVCAWLLLPRLPGEVREVLLEYRAVRLGAASGPDLASA